jgi:hypothetical protein
MNEEEEFSSITEGFKEGWSWPSIRWPPPPPPIDWGRIRRDMENAARAAREWAERTAREALERSQRLARELADRITRETREREQRAREEAERIRRETEARIKRQREEDERRRILALEAQIASLTRELSNYRGVENEYLQKKGQYDLLVKEFNTIKGKYETELLNQDNLKANINTADKSAEIAIEDKQNVYRELTKQYIDSTKKPKDIYDEILKQNLILDEKIKHLKDSFTTDDQKVFYENQQYEYLSQVINVLFTFYYLLVFILAFIIFIYNRNNGISIIMKAIILLAFLIYPFAINIIEKTIYNTFIFTYSIINGDAYVNQ